MKALFERTSLNWSEDSIRLIETPSQTAKDYYLYIQEAGYFQTQYPYFTERQNLNSFLIIYTLSGQGRLYYEGQEYSLKKGNVVLIHCMNYHFYESSREEPWEILWTHFNGFNAMVYYEELTKNGFPVLNTEDALMFEHTLRRIISLHQKKDACRELISSNLIGNLLTELILMNTPKEYFSHNAPEYVNEIKKKLNRDFAEKINLDDLSALFHISKFHMAKEFKKYTGTTINEYLIDQRINHAKELLKYSDLPVSEIACVCGINHTSHFINLFKDREGITPLAFRKEWN